MISWTTKPRYRSTQYILGIILIMLPYTAFTAATIFLFVLQTFLPQD